MLNTFNDITETLKRGVTLGMKTKVLYRDPQTSEVKELLQSFPENLAMTFCPKLTTQRVKPYGKAILVTGSTSDAHVAILQWMLACAEAKKVIPFPKFQGFIFYRATRVSKAAQLLGIGELVDAMEARCKSIARNQIHTDDVWRVYTDPDCAEYKEMVAKSVAKAIYENRLKAASQVRILRREMPHVNDDIKYELDYLKAYSKAV